MELIIYHICLHSKSHTTTKYINRTFTTTRSKLAGSIFISDSEIIQLTYTSIRKNIMQINEFRIIDTSMTAAEKRSEKRKGNPPPPPSFPSPHYLFSIFYQLLYYRKYNTLTRRDKSGKVICSLF